MLCFTCQSFKISYCLLSAADTVIWNYKFTEYLRMNGNLDSMICGCKEETICHTLPTMKCLHLTTFSSLKCKNFRACALLILSLPCIHRSWNPSYPSYVSIRLICKSLCRSRNHKDLLLLTEILLKRSYHRKIKQRKTCNLNMLNCCTPICNTCHNL